MLAMSYFRPQKLHRYSRRALFIDMHAWTMLIGDLYYFKTTRTCNS